MIVGDEWLLGEFGVGVEIEIVGILVIGILLDLFFIVVFLKMLIFRLYEFYKDFLLFF